MRNWGTFGQFDSIGFANFYEEEYGIHKRWVTISGKFGIQIVSNDRFSYVFELGLGARYRNVVHFDRINLEDNMFQPRHPNVHYFSNSPGKEWIVAIPIRFRLGYLF